MTKGTIKWYNPSKGYGFIAQDDGGKDVFLHRNEIPEGSNSFNEGDKIEFEIVEGEKGPNASKVTKV